MDDAATRIEAACAALCTTLESNHPMNEETCRMLLSVWLEDLDPNQEMLKNAQGNDVHTFGVALSVCLHTTLSHELAGFKLREALGKHAKRVCVHEDPLHTLGFQQILDVILSLQIEFAKMYTTDSDGAIESTVDVETVVLMLFARLGFFLGNRWRGSAESLEVVQGLVEVYEDNWHRVALPSAVGALDAVHAMLVAGRMLASAECLRGPDPPELVFNFHREASLDDFYDVSTAADCPVGAILQYKHRFRYLFHSVSQVVYFHYPAYQRRKQIALEQLQARDAPALNLLPLLAQVVVDIPVLAEHSGLGCHATHARQPWAWAVVAQRVLLVRSDMRVFCARDLRTLLLHAQPDAADKTDA